MARASLPRTKPNLRATLITSRIAQAGQIPNRQAECARLPPRRWSATRIPSSRPRPGSDKLLDVLADQVGLKVHRIADFPLPQCRVFVSVRNYPDPKAS